MCVHMLVCSSWCVLHKVEDASRTVKLCELRCKHPPLSSSAGNRGATSRPRENTASFLFTVPLLPKSVRLNFSVNCIVLPGLLTGLWESRPTKQRPEEAEGRELFSWNAVSASHRTDQRSSKSLLALPSGAVIYQKQSLLLNDRNSARSCSPSSGWLEAAAECCARTTPPDG